MKLCVVVLISISYGEAVTQGPLVLVGGNLQEDNSEIYDKIVELSGGKGIAKIGVVTAANGNAESSGAYYVDMFQRYGAATVYWIPVQESDPGAAFSSETVGNILQMGGIFFGGGEPFRIVKTMFTEEGGVRADTPVLTAIKTMWQVGAMVAGTSAGIEAMQSNIMITGGLNYNALVYGAMPSSTPQDNLTYDPLGGLGFLDGVIIDAHFSEKEREARLIKLVADTRGQDKGATKGLGLDEDTALVCQSGVCQVIGSAGVWAVDLSKANIKDSDGWWMCADAITTYLTPEDSLTLSSWTSQFANWKTDLAGLVSGEKVETSNSLFNGTIYRDGSMAEYSRVVNSLLLSKASGAYGNTQQSDLATYQVQWVKTQETRSVMGQRPGNGKVYISYEGLSVNFVPGYLAPKLQG